MNSPDDEKAARGSDETSHSSQRLPSTWRINHPAEAGGPSYVQVEPSPAARAAFMKIGVTVTELFDGPLEGVAAERPAHELSGVLKERARVASVLLLTIGGLEHFENEPHWRREIANIRQLVADIASHLGRGG